MKYLILLSVFLTGCASNCKEACILGFGPGSDAFQVVANHYDSRDPCQFKNKPANYELPKFCNTSSRTINVYTPNGQKVYVIK